MPAWVQLYPSATARRALPCFVTMSSPSAGVAGNTGLWQATRLTQLDGLCMQAQRSVQQLLPYSWTKFEWMMFSSEYL